MSFEISQRQAKEIAEGVRRAGTGFEKMAVVEEVAGFEARHALLWHLVRKSQLRIEHESPLWPELAASVQTASTNDVISFLLRVRKLPKREAPVQALGVWPRSLDEIACRAYSRDPGPFDIVWKVFPAAVRRGFKTVLRRAGKLERERMHKDMAKLLAAEYVLGNGLHGTALTFGNGNVEEVVEVELCHDDELGTPTDDLFRLIDLFCTREQWEQGVLRAALTCKQDLEPLRASAALRLADREQLVSLLRTCKVGVLHSPLVYRALLAERRDSPDDLLYAAAQLADEREYLGEQCVVAAVIRLGERGDEIPTEVDGYFNFRSHFLRDHHHYCLEELVRALRFLPLERRRKVLLERLAHPQYGHAALALIQTLPEPEVVEAGIALLLRSERYSVAALTRAALGLATAGVAALPALEQTAVELRDGRVRDALVRTILFILSDLAAADEDFELDPRFDALLQFHGHEEQELRDHTFSTDVLPCLRTLLRRMPIERREALLIDAIDPRYPLFTRPFACLVLCPTPRVLEHAFDVLATSEHSSMRTERDWVQRAVEELGDAAAPYLERFDDGEKELGSPEGAL